MAGLPEKLKIIMVTRRADVETVKAVAPDRLEVIDAFNDFYPALVRDWPQRGGVIEELLGSPPDATPAPERTEELIRTADIMVISMPYPRSMADRAVNLKWIHFMGAGPSLLYTSPWWNGPVPVTTGRGQSSPIPIGETAFAATLMFAKRLDTAAINTSKGFDLTVRPPMSLFHNKTMGIVGLGGIGSELAKLCKAVGMRVVATRRSAAKREADTQGVDVLYPAAELEQMLPECDFVTLGAYWTQETENMMSAPQFAKMKPGAFLINIARGNLTNEDDLAKALQSGHLGGAYIDTWAGELEGPPPPALINAPNVVMTPHISGRSDLPPGQPGGLRILCENLRRFLDGDPMANVIEWERGY